MRITTTPDDGRDVVVMTKAELAAFINHTRRDAEHPAMEHIRLSPGLVCATDGHRLLSWRPAEPTDSPAVYLNRDDAVMVGRMLGRCRVAAIPLSAGESVRIYAHREGEPVDDALGTWGRVVDDSDVRYPDTDALLAGASESRGVLLDPRYLAGLASTRALGVHALRVVLRGEADAARFCGAARDGGSVIALVMPMREHR